MQVLGYKCKVTEGAEGYYADFSIGIQSHWDTVREIGKKLHSIENAHSDFYKVNWLKYLKNCKFDLSTIKYEECLFPEFQYLEDLMRFISYLNLISKKHPKNFINLSVLL